MLYPVEQETGSLLWICPQCGKVVKFPNFQAARLAEQAGLCMDCRAERTLQKHPELFWLLRDFSKRSDKKYSFLNEVGELKDCPEAMAIIPFRMSV